MAKDAFSIAAHAVIEQFKYAKKPPHLKKSIKEAYLENGTYEQIVTHLDMELELNGLESPDELQIKTSSHKIANANADRPKQTCHHCKKPGHFRSHCRLLEKQLEQTENNQNNAGNKKGDANTSNRTPKSLIITTTTTTKTVTEPKESQKLFFHPVRLVARQTIPQRNATMEPMQPIDRLPGKEDRKDKFRSKKEPTEMTRMK